MAQTNLKAGQIRWARKQQILYIIIEVDEWCQVMVLSSKNHNPLDRRTWYYDELEGDEVFDDAN